MDKKAIRYDLGTLDSVKLSLNIRKTNAEMPGDGGQKRVRYDRCMDAWIVSKQSIRRLKLQ